MRSFLAAALAALTLTTAALGQPDPKFQRGAQKSPPHKLASAQRFTVQATPPAQFAVVPAKLDMWGNDKNGCCVTSEEAAADAWWSTYCGLPETFITAAEVTRYARAHGTLNGAMLTDTLDSLQKDGFRGPDGKAVLNGGYAAVDYSNLLALKAACATGPVKIAIDANALPSGAGNKQGWYAVGRGNFPNTDHCVGLFGYGPAKWLYEKLGVPLPSALAPDKEGFLLYTWSTIGFVDFAWLQGTCTEAWVRNPTTPGQSPPAPTPPIPPDPIPPIPVPPIPPIPVPPVPGVGFTGSLNYVNGVLVSVTTTPVPTPTPVNAFAPLEAAVGAKVDPVVIVGDIIALYAAYASKDPVAIAIALAKLMADLKGPPSQAMPAKKVSVVVPAAPRTPVRTVARAVAAPVVAAVRHWTHPGPNNREGIIRHLRIEHVIVGGPDILEYLTYEELLSLHDASHEYRAFNFPNLTGRTKVSVNVAVAAPAAQPVYQFAPAASGGCPGGVCPTAPQQRGLFNFGIFR